MKSAIALVALAASVAATDTDKPVEVWDSKDTLCKGWDLRTAEGVADLWQRTAAGSSLELFINIHWEHEHNWLKNMEDQVQDGTSGKSGAAGCAALGNECNPMDGISCDEHWDRFGVSAMTKNSYWTFQAVRGMHSKFRELSRQLTQETLISGLRIGTMISDFDGNEDNPGQAMAWIAGAATMGNAIGGLVPGVGGGIAAGFGVIGGLFTGLASRSGDQPVNQGTISAALADCFQQVTGALENTLRIATGGGNSPEEYDSLPISKQDSSFKTSIAKFFNGGWFLLDDDEDIVRQTVGSISNNIQSKVANDIMKAARLHLVADRRENVRSRESCGFNTGRQWLELKPGEEYCFYLMRHNSNPNRRDEWVEASPDIYEKMESYGLWDRIPYYRANINCALNGGEDKDRIDLGSMAWGQVPTCYFNLPTVFIDPDTGAGCGSPFDIPRCDYLKATPVS